MDINKVFSVLERELQISKGNGKIYSNANELEFETFEVMLRVTCVQMVSVDTTHPLVSISCIPLLCYLRPWTR